MTAADWTGELDRLAQAATPGPWQIDPHDTSRLDSIVSTARDYLGGWVEVARSIDDDAAFIAAARDGIPRLIAEVRALAARLAAVEALADEWETRSRRGDRRPIEPFWAANAVRAALAGGDAS